MTFAEVVALDAPEAAQALLGWTLLADGVGGRVVEVEAYREDDPASHSFGGPRGRNVTMFGPAGRLYVYRSYGVHWCANVVCGADGAGAAVLLRALEPTHGRDVMRDRRRVDDERLLCSGPGRLAQALALTGADTGAELAVPRFVLTPPHGTVLAVATPRIGITKARERPWRFVEEGSRWTSRRPRTA